LKRGLELVSVFNLVLGCDFWVWVSGTQVAASTYTHLHAGCSVADLDWTRQKLVIHTGGNLPRILIIPARNYHFRLRVNSSNSDFLLVKLCAFLCITKQQPENPGA